MKSLPTWSICLLAAGFGYFGGTIGRAESKNSGLQQIATEGEGRMMLADRQIPPAGAPQGGVRIQSSQQVSELVMIGDTLKITSQRGNPVAAFVSGPEGGGLVLLDSSGQPSVSIMAGSQGRVAISTLKAGGIIEMGGKSGSATINLTGNPEKASLSVMSQGQNRAIFGAISSGGGGMTLLDKKGNPMVELLSQAGNGAGFFKKSDGKVSIELSHDPNLGGLIRSFGEKESRRVDIAGETGVFVMEKGTVKASLPSTN